MKIIAFMCTFNDCEFLEQAIRSFAWFPERLFIIEGSWKSSQSFGDGSARSDAATQEILAKFADDPKISIIHANEARERDHRQIGMELAKDADADWVWMLDSDEIYLRSHLFVMRNILQNARETTLGFRVRSFNFLNNLKTWYDGNYARIYRPLPNAKFIMDNDVSWGIPGDVMMMPEALRFFHYNYVKRNATQFWRKMHYQAEQDPTFNERLLPQYGHDGLNYRIPADIKTFEFHGKHPRIMREHPYFSHLSEKDFLNE